MKPRMGELYVEITLPLPILGRKPADKRGTFRFQFPDVADSMSFCRLGKGDPVTKFYLIIN